jgi:NAD(P)-dependent dehydrogenase (short-subunit alcohol dehydrogenase family)
MIMIVYRRLTAKGSKVTVNAVHPGLVMTDVTRNMPFFMRIGDALAQPLMMLLRKTPAQGAYSSVHVATSPKLEGIGGLYFQNCHPARVGSAALDTEAAAELWKISEKLTGLVQ